MLETNALIDLYIAAWNEADGAQRQQLIVRTYTEDAEYLDPLMQGQGWAGLNAMIGAARSQFPGFMFHRMGDAEHHHDAVRFSWALTSPEGVTAARGTDVARLAEDGRFRSVIGFLDEVPGGTA